LQALPRTLPRGWALAASGQGARPRRAQRAAKAADPAFREALFDALVELRAARELLQLDSPALERHLRASGGLPERGPLAAGAPVGPLEPQQARPRGAGASGRPGARQRARRACAAHWASPWRGLKATFKRRLCCEAVSGHAPSLASHAQRVAAAQLEGSAFL